MSERISGSAVIRNRRGLHARAAARFVKCAESFQADIFVAKQGTEVSGCSIMGLMMLAAAQGSEIEIHASGPDARQAFDTILRLIETKFDEE